MPFVPHTPDDERRMLAEIGVSSIEALFDEIPEDLKSGVLTRVPDAISEMELLRLMNERARSDEVDLCFLGGGAYEHHVPSAVWDLVSRGEFMTAYTPYQAEASQGTLQVIYEFQTMMARLTAMEVANASVYDGGSALAEAVLMAVRGNKKSRSRRVLTLSTVHPRYVSATRNIVRNQQIEIETVPYGATGIVSCDDLPDEDFAALVIPCPNFFGCIEDVGELTDWAHARGALVIAVVNPTALALLQPPGRWGEAGADIVVGEAQPLGIPVSSGGPYCGFMCCSKALVRQMPGRIIGKTVDTDGRTGFALTLQAREQHIRRGKATSNICTNQGLLVTAATIYLSLMGDEGLRSIALQGHQGMSRLLQRVARIDGVSRRFSAPMFHEAVIELPRPANDVIETMRQSGILPGYDLGEISPELDHCLLTNVTETKTDADIERFASTLESVLAVQPC